MAQRGDGLNDIFDNDLEVKKRLRTNEGTISSAPVNPSDIANKAYVDNNAGTPVGTITMTAVNTYVPVGWLLCNNSQYLRAGTYAALFAAIGTTFGVGDGSTTFNVPDMRGIFPRGAGTSAKLTNANGTAFAGTFGTYQNDKFQGHRHGLEVGTVSGGTQTGVMVATKSSTDSSLRIIGAYELSDGTPRTGAETNPANLGLNFIIKY